MSTADHPLMGMWLAMANPPGQREDPQFPAPSLFTAVQAIADMTGKLVGSVTIDGHPNVSADGMSFSDDGSLVTVTIRDPAGAVVNVIPPAKGPPVTAIKMRVGNPGFPGEEAATPVP
jgi:hypothetical protein